jgi:hypothetical protein
MWVYQTKGGIHMFSKLFFIDAAERAVKTFAQVLLALLLVAPNTPLLGFDWPSALGLAGTAVVISFLTSLVSGGFRKTTDANTVSPASLAPDNRGI